MVWGAGQFINSAALRGAAALARRQVCACLRQFSTHPLLPSFIFSTSLVSVKIRASETIRAMAIKIGAAHLVGILPGESSWLNAGR
jgi:7-keto-8-aminopelargonate synthetase-like enzyme